MAFTRVYVLQQCTRTGTYNPMCLLLFDVIARALGCRKAALVLAHADFHLVGFDHDHVARVAAVHLVHGGLLVHRRRLVLVPPVREPQQQLTADVFVRLVLGLGHEQIGVRHDGQAHGAKHPEVARRVQRFRHGRVRLDDDEAQYVVEEHQQRHAYVAHVGREHLGVDDVRHHAHAQRERDHVDRQAEHW